MWKIYLLKMSWMNLGYLKQTSMHEIYFVSHLAVHIDREQTSLFFGEVLYASQKKQKKTKNTVKKKLTLKGHKSFGSDALENLTSCAASTSILWLLIFFWTRATDFTAKKGLLNLLLNNTFRKYPHLKNNINHSKNEAKNVRISYIYEITWLELLKLTSRKLRSFE